MDSDVERAGHDTLRNRRQKSSMNNTSEFSSYIQQSTPLEEKNGVDSDGTRTYPKYEKMFPKTSDNARDRRNVAEHPRPFKSALSSCNDDADLNCTGSDEHLRKPLLGASNGNGNGTDVVKGGHAEVEVEVSSRSSGVKDSNVPELVGRTDSYGYLEEKDMIAFYMSDRKMEIMAVVEGIDATTGGVVQARHSFVPS